MIALGELESIKRDLKYHETEINIIRSRAEDVRKAGAPLYKYSDDLYRLDDYITRALENLTNCQPLLGGLINRIEEEART